MNPNELQEILRELKTDLKGVYESVNQIKTDIAVLKTRLSYVSGAFGVVGGVAASVISIILGRV